MLIKKKYQLFFIMAISGLVAGCVGELDFQEKSGVTAPGISSEVQKNYLPIGSRDVSESARDSIGDIDTAKYQTNVENYNKVANAIQDKSSQSGSGASYSQWSKDTTYAAPGSKVLYSKDGKNGVFINKWWTKGNEPSFVSSAGPWEVLERRAVDGKVLKKKDIISKWSANVDFYKGKSAVKHTVNGTEYCFEAKYWVGKGTEPVLTKSGGGTLADWESPWKSYALGDANNPCNSDEEAKNLAGFIKPYVVDPADKNADKKGGASSKLPIETPPPASDSGSADNTPQGTPVVPPVIAKKDPAPVTPPAKPEPIKPVKISGTDGKGDGLPASGYDFLRLVSNTHWDWMFPMRSGRYNTNGGTRNRPPMAVADGSKDTFSLANFKKAVLEYNSWAKSKGYKQFLTEGTLKQQAQEFLAFWGKACRETSGSWATAKAPWITSYTSQATGENTKVWKGCLYWVEEVGYSTNDKGESSAINYVDAGSSFRPVAKRSYYGRGVVQLSWNYNYGAFSAWLYDNGMLTDVITSRDALLTRPDYVATNGTLSILSAIWFWMTPQGAKPSSHDVLYGDKFNISQTTKEEGLPQRNDNGNIAAASGDTIDEAVMAYRFGTIINIVNGGLECNRAAKWHGGPPQRVSYFNAFSLYFNDQISGLGATYIPTALKNNEGIWNEKVTASSNDIIKTATCYSQKVTMVGN